MKKSLLGYFSVCVAAVVLVYYVAYWFACVLLSLLVMDRIKSSPDAAEPLPDAVEEVTSQHPWLSVCAFTLEGLCQPKSVWQLMSTPVTLTKNLLLSVLIVWFEASNTQWQVGLAVCAETVYLGYILFGAKKSSKAELFTNGTSQFFLVGYLLGKLPTTFDISEKSRQSVFGMWMAVCLIGIVVVSLCFALLTLVVAVIEKVKGCCKKKEDTQLQDVSSSQLHQSPTKENPSTGAPDLPTRVLSSSTLPATGVVGNVQKTLTQLTQARVRTLSTRKIPTPVNMLKPKVFPVRNRPWTPESQSDTNNGSPYPKAKQVLQPDAEQTKKFHQASFDTKSP